MHGYNKVIIAGNLTKDPEIRMIQEKTKLCLMTVAINENYKSVNGKKTSAATFVNVTAWSHLANICEKFLRKGSPVLVEGKLNATKWTTKIGAKMSRLGVLATMVKVLGAVSTNPIVIKTHKSPSRIARAIAETNDVSVAKKIEAEKEVSQEDELPITLEDEAEWSPELPPIVEDETTIGLENPSFN